MDGFVKTVHEFTIKNGKTDIFIVLINHDYAQVNCEGF